MPRQGLRLEVTARIQFKGNFNTEMKKEIVQAVQSSPEMRKEIRRVFQMANRRIQNLEKAGVFSPALVQSGKMGVQGYSKYSISRFGKGYMEDWQGLKDEYVRAVAFLNQPTSTASGAKHFEKTIRNGIATKTGRPLPDELWNAIRAKVLGSADAIQQKLNEAMPYQQYLEQCYEEAVAMSQAEQQADAEQEAKRLTDRIDAFAEQTAKDIRNGLESEMKRVFRSLGISNK